MSSPRPSHRQAWRWFATLGAVTAASLVWSASASAQTISPDLAGVTQQAQVLPQEITSQTGGVAVQPQTASAVVMDASGKAQQFPTQLYAAKTDKAGISGYSLNPTQPVPAGDDVALSEVLPISDQAGQAVQPKDAVSPQLNDDTMSKVDWVLQRADTGAGSKTDLGKSVDLLTEKLGTPVGKPEPKQVVAAVQAAVWHYTSGANLTPGRNDQAVTAMYGYLTGPANTGVTQKRASSVVETPQVGSTPPAEILPANVPEGDSVLGPFELSKGVGSATVASVQPQRARLIDSQGKQVTKAAPGQKFFMAIPKGADQGDAVINAVSDPQSPTGRVFGTVDGQQVRPNFMAAGGDQLPVTSAVKVPWQVVHAVTAKVQGAPAQANRDSASTPSSTSSTSSSKPEAKSSPAARAASGGGGSSLPVTGAAVGGVIGAGVLLVGGGVGLFLLNRRRRSSSSNA